MLIMVTARRVLPSFLVL